jgi:hypothetical protein
MKNAVFWVVTQCGSFKNRRLGGMYCLHFQSGKNRRSVNNAAQIVTVMIKAIRSSETSFLIRGTRSSISQDGVLLRGKRIQ